MSDKRVKIIKHNNTSVKFEVDSRYSPLESIGTGAYGVVCAAKDNRTGQRVAIKKIPKVFEVLVIAKRTYRELKILRHLRHENIISILDVMLPPDDPTQFQDVYVVLDLMESDLHHIIHSVQPLSEDHIQFFLYQILRGVKYIHSANVLHRDLKPSNLLINRNCELKIGDFGMARGLSSSPEEHSTFMTEYVATRWYRAPELMLSLSEYTFAIDMWSMGCIVAEMIARRQMFPGKNYLNQLQLILSVVGTPSSEYIDAIGSERVKTYLEALPKRDPVELSVLFPNASEVVLDLMGNLLQLDPKKRISAEEALAHKYLTRYHDPKDEPVCSPPFDFEFEKKLIKKDDLKQVIITEIMDYHKSRLPIPSHDKVMVELKKHIDREKVREKVCAEDECGTSIKETKEGAPPKQKRGHQERKRKGTHPAAQPPDSEKRKKVKSEPGEADLSEQDLEDMERWKNIQRTTRPFPHPIRKLKRQENGSETEVFIKEQAEEIDRLRVQLTSQHKMIVEQKEKISVLLEQRAALIQECQQSGVKVPQIVLSDISKHPSLQTPPPPSVHSSSQPLQPPQPSVSPALPPHIRSQQHTLTPPPPLPPPSVMPNVSPTTRTPPPHPSHILPPQASSAHYLPPTMHTISTVNAPHNIAMSTVPTGYPIHRPPPPPFMPSRHPGIPPPLIDQRGMLIESGRGQVVIPRQVVGGERASSGSMREFTFSPLTSSDFKDLERQNLMDPFPEDLENILDIAGLPTGSGAGYGVGVAEDEELSRSPLRLDFSDMGPPIAAGPPSASLLQDWLDVRQLDPDDMDALQRELETGNPDMFLQGFSEL